MVRSEAERSLGSLASPHRPKGERATAQLAFGHPDCPSPWGSPTSTLQRKTKSSLFRYETQASGAPTRQLQFTQTPARDTESNSNTQDCVFFSMQKWEMTF